MKINPSFFRRAAAALALVALSLGAAPAHAVLKVNPADGTVVDDDTGLIWDQCAYGLSGAECTTGAVASLTWQAALQRVVTANTSNYKNQNNWRLPSVKELESLVEIGAGSPAIDPVAFPNTPPSIFWSSTVHTPNTANAWAVNFGDGGVVADAQVNRRLIRLVRVGRSFDLLTPYTVGGTVTGLTGRGLVLKMGTQTAAISANGDYFFATGLAPNTDYTVSVQTHPTGPVQRCTVSNSSGNVGTANVTDVNVSCVNGYVITVSATPLTGGDVSCDSPVAHGQTSTCTAAPKTGYTLAGISGCGAGSTTSPYTTGPVTSACTVMATFKANQDPLTAMASPAVIQVNGTAELSASGGTGTGTVTYAVTSGQGSCSLNGSTLTGTAVGTCTVTATKIGPPGYNDATAKFEVTVLPVRTMTAVTPVPTLGEWALVLLGLMAAGLGMRRLRQPVSA